MTQNPPPESDQHQTKEQKLEFMTGVLANLQEQIRFADTKAGFIAAFDAALVGILASRTDALRAVMWPERGASFWINVMPILLFLGATIWSIGTAVMAVLPRLGEKVAPSHLHFTHIRMKFKADYEAYFNKATTLSVDEWLRETTDQIVVNSNIADIKHCHVKTATKCAIGAMMLWVVSLAVTFLLPIDTDAKIAAPAANASAAIQTPAPTTSQPAVAAHP